MFESLTGFDEIAISKSFAAEVGVLASNKPTMFLRALVFTDLRRQGLKDGEAKQKVMDMTLKQCNGYFIADEEEIDEEEPETPSGEGVSPLG
jgi:hypothetical protein